MRFLGLFLLTTILYGMMASPIGSARKVIKLMGTRFVITAVAENDTIAWEAVNAGIEEISRIETLISSWNPNSQTSAINQMAGIQAVKVDKELFDLIFRSKKVSTLTGGAFDISFASMDRIWVFDQQEHEMPDSSVVSQARAFINYDNILLNSEDTSVFLSQKGMKIGFGAIGKGYAANKAKMIMSKIPGVLGGVVNASGDLLAWGKSLQPEGWTIQVANPHDKDKPLGWLKVNNQVVVTSGNYEKYFTSEGKRFAHIINPLTGYPTQDVSSVTIICPDAELADALATSVFVLGKEKGLELVNQLNGVECLFITQEGELLRSKNLELQEY